MPLLSSGSLAPNYFQSQMVVIEKLCVPSRNCSLIRSWLLGEALLEVLVLLFGNQGLRSTGCLLGCTGYMKHANIYVRLSQSPV